MINKDKYLEDEEVRCIDDQNKGGEMRYEERSQIMRRCEKKGESSQ